LCRYIDDNLSDAILKHNIPPGCTLTMDIQPDTGDVIVTYVHQESVTVTGMLDISLREYPFNQYYMSNKYYILLSRHEPSSTTQAKLRVTMVRLSFSRKMDHRPLIL
jgi:hypothetical protein